MLYPYSYLLYFYTHATSYVGNYYFFSVDHVQTGRTPLMLASFNGHVEVAKALIGSKAPVNTKNEV